MTTQADHTADHTGKRVCRTCELEKPMFYIGKKRTPNGHFQNKYEGICGRRWNGRRCPECTSKMLKSKAAKKLNKPITRRDRKVKV